MRAALALCIIAIAAACGWYLAGGDPAPGDGATAPVPGPAAVPAAVSGPDSDPDPDHDPAPDDRPEGFDQAPTTDSAPVPADPPPDLPARQRAYQELVGRGAGAVVTLAEGDAAETFPGYPGQGRFTFDLRYRREGRLVEAVLAGDFHHAHEGLVLSAVTMDGKPLIDRCVGVTVDGVLLLRDLEGLDRAAAWRLKQAARQIRFLGSGFPTGRVANGRTAFFPAEDLVASVPGDGTVLLVARHEIGERNGKRVYPRVRGALSEVQVTLTAEGRYGRICRVYGSSAVDGDDFELYRLEIDCGGG